MAAKSFDPTANPFELLANAESQQDAAVARKKPVRKQEEAAQPVGATALTPAEKAKARAAKEAAKAKNQESSSTTTQTDKEVPKKKLTREQYLEEKRKGTITDAVEQAPGESPSTRPARARGEQAPAQSSSERSRGGGNRGGRGGGRGRGGGGLGRGRGGEGDKSGRALGDKDHHHQPPAHGRDYDKKSGMKTGRHAVAKRGGAGGNNWGDDKDDLAGQTGADTVELPSDDAAEKNAPADDAAATTTNTDVQQAAPDTDLTYEDYLKKKAEQDAALAMKIGAAPAPRKVEAPADLDKYVDSHADQSAKAPEKKKEEPKKTGPKFVPVDEIFDVRTPPPLSQRGRGGRGRGRGGRGGGEGGNREGGYREGGNREGGNREGGNRESGNRESGNREGGNREGGNREGGNREGGNREGGNREGGNREGGNREGGDQRDQRGDQRGERGGRGGRGRGGQGNSGRGQGRGGQRRGGRTQLDSSDTRHFPDLGSN